MRLIKSVLMLATLLITNAYADGFSASVGADYSTGKYGTRDSTDVFYMPLSGTYDTGAFSFKVIVPYVRVTGPGDIVPGGFGFSGSSSGSSGAAGAFGCAGDSRNGASKPEDDGVCADTGTSTTTATGKRKRTTESGLGDIVASATYNALDTGENGVVLDFTGRIKLPTASESRGLGSGKADFAVQTNFEKNFGAPYIGVGLGLRKLGEPSGVDYRTVVYGSLEGGYKVSDKTSFGVSYDWATAAVSGASRPQEISAFAAYRINNQYKLNGVIYSGLSNASSDVGGGLTLSYYF